jgi:hypothetical protein
VVRGLLYESAMKAIVGLLAALVLSGCSISVVQRDGDSDGEEITASARQSLSCAPDDGLFDSALTVCRDLSFAGDVVVEGNASVGGDLSYAGDFDVSGATRMTAPACGKGGFDVAGAVARARDNHDHGAATVLESGRYYFGDSSFVGDHHIRVTGHASMFVDGDLTFVGESSIFVEAGASLDLYIAGSVRTVGSMVAAGCDPRALRVFVGGHDSIIAGAGESELRGFLYAPDAEVSFAGTTQITGAVVAKEISFAGGLRVKGIAPPRRPDASCRVPAKPEVTVN